MSYNNFKMGFNQAMFNAKANMALVATQAKPYIATAMNALRTFGTTIRVSVNSIFVKIATAVRNAVTAIKTRLHSVGVRVASIAKTIYQGARGFLVKIVGKGKQAVTKVKGAYRNHKASVTQRKMQNNAAQHFSTMNDDTVIPRKFGKVRTAAGKMYDGYRRGIDNLAKKIVPQRKVKQSASQYITQAKVKLASTPQRVVSGAIRGAIVTAAYGVGQLGIQGIMNASSREDE